MIYVFIDSNMFLKMYSYDYNLSNPLKDIIKLVNSKEIKLIMTQQVIDEVNRNREAMLKSSLEKVKKWRDSALDMPSFCENIKTTTLIKKFSKKVYNDLFKDSQDKTLEVDKLFKEIIKKSEIISISEELLKKAKERFDRGNPPGKKGSYGDCINWLILLEKIPPEEDLYFIGGDNDFLSALDNEIFSGFLREEWESIKRSEIIFYKSILKFLKEEFEEKEITEDQIKKEESISSSPYWGIYSPGKVSQTASGAKIISGSDLIKREGIFPTETGSVLLPEACSSANIWLPPAPSRILQEKEIKCPSCNKIFYDSTGQRIIICPYCNTSF